MKHEILRAGRNCLSASMTRHTGGTEIGKDVVDVQKYLENFPVFPVQPSEDYMQVFHSTPSQFRTM